MLSILSLLNIVVSNPLYIILSVVFVIIPLCIFSRRIFNYMRSSFLLGNHHFSFSILSSLSKLDVDILRDFINYPHITNFSEMVDIKSNSRFYCTKSYEYKPYNKMRYPSIEEEKSLRKLISLGLLEDKSLEVWGGHKELYKIQRTECFTKTSPLPVLKSILAS